MSVIGNSIIISSKIRSGPKIIGWHKITAGAESFTRMTNTQVCDSKYFTGLGSGEYRCLKSGTYYLQLFARGCGYRYETSTNATTSSIQAIRVRNGASTTLSQLSKIGQGGSTSSETSIDLEVGDQIYFQMRLYGERVAGDAAYAVYI